MIIVLIAIFVLFREIYRAFIAEAKQQDKPKLRRRKPKLPEKPIKHEEKVDKKIETNEEQTINEEQKEDPEDKVPILIVFMN